MLFGKINWKVVSPKVNLKCSDVGSHNRVWIGAMKDEKELFLEKKLIPSNNQSSSPLV